MRITEVRATPLAMPVEAGQHRTAWGEYTTIGIVLVEVRTDAGITGHGEGLARAAPQAYARVIEDLLAPRLLGQDPYEIERLWQAMFRVLSGRSGGMLMEALSAVDIALWDLMGRALGQPVHRLLGTMGRERVVVYASSISWNAEAVAEAQIEASVRQGYPMLKLKLGAPPERAIAWARRVRGMVPEHVRLCADANWAYDLDDAILVAKALADLGFVWLEEPLVPEDVQGYRALRATVPIRIAAGESEHTASVARELIAHRAVGVIQPDCTRAGGITETRRIAYLAHAFNVAYAPHVGGGGAVAAAANLHLAAAMPNFLTYEAMIFPSALRDELATPRVVDPGQISDGTLPVPSGPGLGIEIDPEVVGRFRVE